MGSYAMPRRIRVVSAIIEQENRYLITQRRKTAVMPLLWEFPGGKVEKDEDDVAALKRELRERLAADFSIGRKLGEKHHKYDNYEVDVALYAASLVPGQTMRSKRVNDFRWVASADLSQYAFPDADEHLKKIVEAPPES